MTTEEPSSEPGLAVRLLVTGLCLVLVAWLGAGRWPDVSAALGEVSGPVWLFSGLCLVGGAVCYGARWRLLHQAYGAPRPVSFVGGSGLSLVGLFYGQLIPTQLGVDAVQAALTRNAFERSAASVLIVGLGRVVGTAGLVVLAGALLLIGHVEWWLRLGGGVGGIGAIALGMIVLIAPPAAIRRRLEALGMRSVPGWRASAQILLLSIGSQVAHLAGVWILVASATGTSFRADMAAVVLLSQLAGVLPSAFGFGAAQLTLGAYLAEQFGLSVGIAIPAAHWAVCSLVAAVFALVDAVIPFERP